MSFANPRYNREGYGSYDLYTKEVGRQDCVRSGYGDVYTQREWRRAVGGTCAAAIDALMTDLVQERPEAWANTRVRRPDFGEMSQRGVGFPSRVALINLHEPTRDAAVEDVTFDLGGLRYDVRYADRAPAWELSYLAYGERFVFRDPYTFEEVRHEPVALSYERKEWKPWRGWIQRGESQILIPPQLDGEAQRRYKYGCDGYEDMDCSVRKACRERHCATPEGVTALAEMLRIAAITQGRRGAGRAGGPAPDALQLVKLLSRRVRRCGDMSSEDFEAQAQPLRAAVFVPY